MGADGARSIVASLEPLAEKHNATERVVAFAGPVRLNSDARQMFEHAGIRSFAIDLDDNDLIAL